MLLPRVRRGGTMRPENSSKLWLKTACGGSPESTALSGVTPFRLELTADWEMPLATASFLKSASHASNVPVPQATVASAGAAGIIRTADSANDLKMKGRVIGAARTICHDER